MFNPTDIIDVMAKNVKKTKNPFGINTKHLNTWWKTEDLKEEGEYLLFTGLMYQMIPYIDVATSRMEQFEDKKISNYTSFGKYIPSGISSMIMEKLISRDEKDISIEVLKNIVWLLKKSNVDFYYRPDLDMYSGILLYDLGDVKYFKEHANYVASILRANKVQKIITVDPHTTYALKVLYPKYVYTSFDVVTYLELLQLEGNGTKEVVLHDPCFYGRYLDLSDCPRNLLKQIGVNVVDIQRNGKFTHCCGGPAESLSPKLAGEVRKNRISQLKKNGNLIITMCPICYANLKKETSNIQDMANFLKDVLIN